MLKPFDAQVRNNNDNVYRKKQKKNNENQWVWKQTPWTTFYTHFRYVRSLSQAKAPSVTFVRSCLRADGHGHTFDVWILSQQIG